MKKKNFNTAKVSVKLSSPESMSNAQAQAVNAQFMFEVSSSFKDTRPQMWAPLLDSPIDDFLTKALPFLDQPLLQVTDVANVSSVTHAPAIRSDRIEIRAVYWWPQKRRDDRSPAFLESDRNASAQCWSVGISNVVLEIVIFDQQF